MKSGCSRRSFLSGSMLAIGAGAFSPGCVPVKRNCGVSPVRIGIISDTHITGPECAAELERALRFFLLRKVDAVLHCGDVTDLGYLSELEVFIETWRRMMPPEVRLVAVLGNRDVSDTSKISAETRKAHRASLILSSPDSAVSKLCGEGGSYGLRAAMVRDIAIVAADWGKEGGLEAFLSSRPDLRKARAIVSVQHPHPAGTVYAAREGDWLCDDGRSTCYLKMLPHAWSFSGHSHNQFSEPLGFWRGDFTAVSAGSYYLGPPTAAGGKEVSVLTFCDGESELERTDLSTGFCEKISTAPGRKRDVCATGKDGGEIVFAQWNIGHFSFGKYGDTDIPAEFSASRSAAYRQFLDSLGCDIIGINEFSPNFDKGGGLARDLVFGGFRHFACGPHNGYHCNAIASAQGAIEEVSVKDFPARRQEAYRMACKISVHGRRVKFVETHLDLSADERRRQLESLAEEFGSCERVILSGDFNVADVSEYRVLAQKGFTSANFGRFGSFNTHRRRKTSFTPAIDNVFVKGFEIVGVRTADDLLEFSDHRILVCRLRPA